ncbi:hypothetical protein [Candidatus Enterococcus leclercqii]|mgnify:CR=1 FL=1|uniref:hypothetical protein n=1 Tax=Candidatus Enterococcus leclercqii TaxID=1857218 RepID=UPI00137A4326|nr:hypothetical protein [Enterococcus sp. CU9D]KAF1291357.1 hypothetical protein BAU14_00505 [Enterococcus sp. CU9D]
MKKTILLCLASLALVTMSGCSGKIDINSTVDSVAATMANTVNQEFFGSDGLFTNEKISYFLDKEENAIYVKRENTEGTTYYSQNSKKENDSETFLKVTDNRVIDKIEALESVFTVDSRSEDVKISGNPQKIMELLD